MKDVFLADAHLHDPASANYRRLLDFLATLEGETRTLFLLGDIFEFWIGYRHTVFAPYVPVLEALHRLRRSGTDIVYVEGNHDFQIGPYFEEVLDCRILPDGGEVLLGDTRVFVTHGDLIDTTDTSYLLLRRFLRSNPLRWFKNAIPPDLAWRIAAWAGRQSRKGYPEDSERRLPENLLLAHARECFARGSDAVISAHFHLPWLQQDNGRTVVSLGDWIRQYSYAVHEEGTFRLATY